MKLKGKVAFITGFGSGLGQAIAVMFAQEGRRGGGHVTDGIKGRETVTLVEKVGGRALFWPGDVSNSAQMKTFIDETVRQLGGIDIIVNSGGVRTNGSIIDISEADWDRTLDINLKGAFIVSRLAIPEMKKRGGGVILHIAARSGMIGQGGRAAYCASKVAWSHSPKRWRWITPKTRFASIVFVRGRRAHRWSTPRRRKSWLVTKPGCRSAASASQRTSPMRRCIWRQTRLRW
jgi:NAD(P)-dependent dehydrogenase (short-subunit alcohol dehydrogenase family)